MNKFKEGDEIVRTANFWKHAPEGWTSKVANGNKYIDKHGDLWQIRDCNWELAEDTSKLVYTQEMYDNNELPAVGMNFATEAGEYIAKYTNEKSVCFTDENGFLVAINRGYAKPIPAPIDLDHGKAYTFGYGNKLNAVGIYDKNFDRFYFLEGRYFGAESCTNIRPMTVAESK